MVFYRRVPIAAAPISPTITAPQSAPSVVELSCDDETTQPRTPIGVFYYVFSNNGEGVHQLSEIPDNVDELIAQAWDDTAQPDTLFATGFNIDITRRDLLRLKDDGWLNDELVNFYPCLIRQRLQGDNALPKVHILRQKSSLFFILFIYLCLQIHNFNTYFYVKLRDDGYSAVRRYTHVNILDYDLLLFPIHTGIHWCLAVSKYLQTPNRLGIFLLCKKFQVVDFRQKNIAYYNSLGGSDQQYLDLLM